MKWTVSKKIVGSFSIVLILLSVMVAISYYQITTVDNTYNNLITDKAQKLIDIQKLRVAAKEKQASLREYLIMGNENALKNVFTAHYEYQRAYDRLAKEIHLPKAAELIKGIKDIENEYNQFSNRAIELKKFNKEAEYSTLMTTVGQDITKRFDQKVEELIKFQEALLKQGDQDTTDKVAFVKNLVLVLGIAAVLLGLVIASIIGRMISKPVLFVANTAKRMADGDLTVETIQVKNKDEIGQLADSFNKMTQNLRDVIKQVGLNAEYVASAAEELTASAEQTSRATSNIAETMQEIAVGTDREVQSAEETAQTVEEMSMGVQQIAQNTQHVSSTAVATSERAVQGRVAIDTAIHQMNSIHQTVNGLANVIKGFGERSNEISQISEVITGIAAQTNLLALNAAIEAARAGENGRGFSVVADEVRKLAEQSAESAQQISKLIVAIQKEADHAVESMGVTTKEVVAGIEVVSTAGESFSQIQTAIDEVTNQSQDVSSAVQQMAAGTEQMVQSMRFITEISQNISASTQGISASTEEQLASMEEISSSANSLSSLAEDLQILIQKFKI